MLCKVKFVLVISISLLLSFAGCETVKVKYVDSEDFPSDRVYRLKTAYLYDGRKIDLPDDAKFKVSFKDKNNVIVYDYEEKFIELKDISSLKIEVVDSDTVLTVTIIVGAVALFVLVLWMISAVHWRPH
jgi:hypothetical protein